MPRSAATPLATYWTRTTTLSRDAFDNVTSREVTTSGGKTTTMTAIYQNDETRWLIGRPSSLTVTALL